MIVAIVSTRIPILVGHDFWIFHLAQDIKRTGFWSMMHEGRADLTMLLGSIYLLIEGGGRWSVDAWLGDTNGERKLLPTPQIAARDHS
jgi:uncharacterized membrane protein YphA (DoxX/SURF4 family)